MSTAGGELRDGLLPAESFCVPRDMSLRALLAGGVRSDSPKRALSSSPPAALLGGVDGVGTGASPCKDRPGVGEETFTDLLLGASSAAFPRKWDAFPAGALVVDGLVVTALLASWAGDAGFVAVVFSSSWAAGARVDATAAGEHATSVPSWAGVDSGSSVD